MTVVTRFVQAISHGGLMAHPTLIVVHSAETPLQAGYASSIATNWFGKAATTSAHFMVDPVETIRMLSDNVVAYAVGPNANGFTLNIEQSGYARLSRAEWTTSPGREQIARVGALVRELADAHGIPLQWASDDQIRAAAHGVPGGVCYHDSIRRVLGGTTHSDPMPSYPGDLLEVAWGGKAPSPVEDDMYDETARNELVGRIDQGFADMTNRFNGLNTDDTRTRIGLIQYGMNLVLTNQAANQQVDYDKLAAALVPVLTPLLDKAGAGVSAQELADEFAKRLAA